MILSGEEGKGSGFEGKVDENFSVILEFQHLTRRIDTCIPGAIKV